MLNILGIIFISVATLGLFIVLLISFPSFRNSVNKLIKKFGNWSKCHWLAITMIAILLVAIVMNDFTVRLLAPFSELAIIILGLCIILGAVWKKSFKYAWKLGTIAAGIIFITIVLQKLQW